MKMEEELFTVSARDQVVKALGMKLDCKLSELQIFINGKDITKSVVLEDVRIVKERKQGA
jgi:hypothetical protein